MWRTIAKATTVAAAQPPRRRARFKRCQVSLSPMLPTDRVTASFIGCLAVSSWREGEEEAAARFLGSRYCMTPSVGRSVGRHAIDRLYVCTIVASGAGEDGGGVDLAGIRGFGNCLRHPSLSLSHSVTFLNWRM